MHSVIRTISLLAKCSDPGASFCSFKKVKLIWLAREIQMIEIFYDTWMGITGIANSIDPLSNLVIEMELRCTDKSVSPKASELPISIGRANLEKEISSMQKTGLVYVCGTPALVEEAAKLSYQYSVAFKAEIFIL